MPQLPTPQPPPEPTQLPSFGRQRDRVSNPREVSLFNPLAPVLTSTVLLPGESEVETREDPYYGRVETGHPPFPYLALGPSVDLDVVEGDVRDKHVFLTGDAQNRIEVLTGKRLQQPAMEEGDRERGRRDAKEQARDEVEEDTERQREAERRAEQASHQPHAHRMHDTGPHVRIKDEDLKDAAKENHRDQNHKDKDKR